MKSSKKSSKKSEFGGSVTALLVAAFAIADCDGLECTVLDSLASGTAVTITE